MDAERWTQIQELFDQVIDLSPEQRSALLASHADETVRKEVEALLEQAGSPSIGGRIESAAGQAAASLMDQRDREAEDELLGTTIDGYLIVAKIGAGGFGVVYRAEQSSPVRRIVALKIARGSLSGEGRRRFELESQLLAHVEHPNVAKIYDAGTTDQRPYFVMEHLDGQDIASYCRAHKLPLNQRLRLYLDLCAGVAHAHQRGIIHRDLKPSNALVVETTAAARTGQSGSGTSPRTSASASRSTREPRVKVIDFGIAKATPLTDAATLDTSGVDLTQRIEVLGTLEYMSPEQASLESTSLDTRSDVYCLGSVLYELLTETPPFLRSELTESGYEDALRIVREQDPPRPSVRVASNVKNASHSGSLRGDLDHITMKALAKEPERRYQTVRELMDDVSRFLAGEPVEACAPTWRYLAGKYVRRHRTGVVAAAAILLALSAGIVSTGLGFQRAAEERDKALAANVQAKQSAAEANEVSDFLVELFRASDPEVAQGEEITARELLQAGARRIDQLNEPTATRLRSVVGEVYFNLGLLDDAQPLLEQAVEQRREVAKRTNAESDLRALAMSLHPISRFALDQNDLEAATSAAEEAVEISRRLGESPLLADSLDHAFEVHYWNGDEEAMGAIVKEALALREATLKEVGLSNTESNREARIALADTQLKATKYWAQQREFPRGLETVELGVNNYEAVLDALHPKLLNAKRRHAWMLAHARDAERAPAVALDVLDRLIAVYGKDHTAVAAGYGALGSAYYRASLEHEKALEAFDQALAIYQRTLGDEHRASTTMKRRRGFALAGLGRYGEAITVHRDILALLQRTLDSDHQEISIEHFNLGSALLHNEDYEDAAKHFYRHLAFRPGDGWWDSYRAARPMNLYARALAGAGDYAEAVRMLERAADLVGTEYGKEHSAYRGHTEILADVYRDWGKIEVAERWLAETKASEEREAALKAEQED